MGYGAPLLGFGANVAADNTLLQQYNSSNSLVAIDSFPKASAPMKSDSDITYNLIPLPRKRTRETCAAAGGFYFLGEDVSVYIQQQQFDLDRLISQHMEKMKMEVEEKEKRQARRIVEVIEMGMMKILKKKEEEFEVISKLNFELEERVNSLYMDNQIWRDVAQTNEATANALRANLEQIILSKVKKDHTPHARGHGLDDPTTTALADDAESCCGSNGDCGEEEIEWDDDGWRSRKRRNENNDDQMSNKRGVAGRSGGGGGGGGGGSDRRCKNCWKEEYCVLLLPCRHLCVCTVCGSSVHTCPICNSTNNASVRVIMP